MMGSKSVPIVTDTMNGRRLLRDIEMVQENGGDVVRLAPSKLLRTPPFQEAHLPLPQPGRNLSFDIPWNYIEEDSISKIFLERFKFIYIQFYCNHCNRVYLTPYITPIWLRTIEDLGYHPIVHYCPSAPFMKIATNLIPLIRMKWPILKIVDIYEANVTGHSYGGLVKYLGSENPNQDTLYKDTNYVDEIIRIPMMSPLQMTGPKSFVTKIIECVFSLRSSSSNLYLKTLINAEDVVALNYIVSDLMVGLEEHNKVIIPLHYDWIKIKEINIDKGSISDYERLY